MSVRDWFRDRVDISLLGSDELEDMEAAEAVGSSSQSPFELVFSKQHGALAGLSAQHKEAFENFVKAGTAGDTLIFFAHKESIRKKQRQAREVRAQGAAVDPLAEAKAKDEAEKKSEDANETATEEKGDGNTGSGGTSPPDAAADEAALSAPIDGKGAPPHPPVKEAPGPLEPGTADFLNFQQEDSGDQTLEVVEERLLYRCILASSIEEELFKEAKRKAALGPSRVLGDADQVGAKKADDGSGATDTLGVSNDESTESLLSGMQNGVVYFSRKESGSGQDLATSCMRTAKQLGLPADADSQLLRDLSIAKAVEWGCLRGLSTHNLSHLSASMRSVFLPFLDSMMAEASSSASSSGANQDDVSHKKSKHNQDSTNAREKDSGASGASGQGFWGHASDFRSQMKNHLWK